MKKFFLWFSAALLFGACQKGEDVVLLSQNIDLREDRIIQDYLKENKLTARKTASGIYYRSISAGVGERTNNGDSIVANYKANEIYGKVFESSYVTNVPRKFRIGVKKAPSLAWEEMPTLMLKGEKMQFFVPSNLAREAGTANTFFPPRTVVVFEVELTDLIRQ